MREVVAWLTGLPCSGKTTIARLAADELGRRGRVVTVLDGDELRAADAEALGFDAESRRRQSHRAAVLAREEIAGGSDCVIVATIGPEAATRQRARALIGDTFVEVHVDAPAEVCAARDVKGMWRLAREGRLPDFTGVSAPYEAPVAPDLRICTVDRDPRCSAAELVALIEQR